MQDLIGLIEQQLEQGANILLITPPKIASNTDTSIVLKSIYTSSIALCILNYPDMERSLYSEQLIENVLKLINTQIKDHFAPCQDENYRTDLILNSPIKKITKSKSRTNGKAKAKRKGKGKAKGKAKKTNTRKKKNDNDNESDSEDNESEKTSDDEDTMVTTPRRAFESDKDEDVYWKVEWKKC